MNMCEELLPLGILLGLGGGPLADGGGLVLLGGGGGAVLYTYKRILYYLYDK